MFNLYTDKKYLKESDMLLWDCDAVFNVDVPASEFGEIELDAMRVIDSAELLDANTGAIVTKFGATDIEHLSTGCKVILTYLYYVRHRDEYDRRPVINTVECGKNAFRYLIKLVDKTDSDVALITHYICNVLDCNDIECMVNDSYVVNNIMLVRV